MIFWRVVDNKLYPINEVKKLGFDESEGLRIPDEHLEQQEFMVMRTAHGIGDWGIISAMPRLLKQKYPNCKVYVPSINLLETLFGQQKQNWGNWDNPFNNVNYIFDNNPYVDGFKDYMVGEVFHDHYRIYNKDKKGIPLVKQMLKFWQFKENEYEDYYPDLYFSEDEIKLGDGIIKDFTKGKEFGGLLITNRFESTGGRYDEESNKGFDLRNVPTRIQLYIRSKSKLNIGTHCGFLDCVSRYSNVFQIQRVFPLNQNLIEAEYYINNENYKEVLTNV